MCGPQSRGAAAGGVRGKTKLVCVAAGGHWPVLSSVWKPEAAVTPLGGDAAPGAACRRPDPTELVVRL